MASITALHYIVAIDVGMLLQPTALTVVEQVCQHSREDGFTCPELRLRHLERLPLDATYPQVSKRASAVIESLLD